jgi:hypothetical protein
MEATLRGVGTQAHTKYAQRVPSLYMEETAWGCGG